MEVRFSQISCSSCCPSGESKTFWDVALALSSHSHRLHLAKRFVFPSNNQSFHPYRYHQPLLLLPHTRCYHSKDMGSHSSGDEVLSSLLKRSHISSTSYDHDRRFDTRNSEDVHKDALEAALAEHERIRLVAVRAIELSEAREATAKLRQHASQEEERVRIETERAQEQCRLRDIENKARSIPKPAPRVPTPPPVKAPQPAPAPPPVQPTQQPTPPPSTSTTSKPTPAAKHNPEETTTIQSLRTSSAATAAS